MTEGVVPAKIEVMGVGVTPFEGYEHAIDVIDGVIEAEDKVFIAAINPEKIYASHCDPKLRKILKRRNKGCQ